MPTWCKTGYRRTFIFGFMVWAMVALLIVTWLSGDGGVSAAMGTSMLIGIVFGMLIAWVLLTKGVHYVYSWKIKDGNDQEFSDEITYKSAQEALDAAAVASRAIYFPKSIRILEY